MSTYTDFVNFLEEYNRYEVEIFRVYITFNGLSNDVSHFVIAQNFVISTCLSYVDRVFVFLRNRVLRLKQKHRWPSLMSTFSSSLQGPFLAMFPVDLFLFFKRQDIDSSSYSFMVMYDKRLGIRIKQRTPNTAALP